MNPKTATARDLFLRAVGDLPPEQWNNYVVGACAGDQPLLCQVRHLLQAHRDAGGFLEQPAMGLDRVLLADVKPLDQAIGPYRLIEEIGEGGFGVVYLAEQVHPLKRRVALKVIKPGMDTRQVIARFEAERQALALMDHPSIAKVFDAGATAAGRPFIVMELVRGVAISSYCDRRRLTTRERLGLFLDVCLAVQHAHQKGVIHRDIKPSNVLVAMQDGRAMVKVIDFGVAKAINQRLTEETLASGFAQWIGTPLYMSPEQAELSPMEIDTRGDIYSLGALLYELLTGSTPFDPARLKQAGFDELRRIIREEEPPRPSVRMSTLAADALSTIAEHRRLESRRLLRAIRGDLDWIVMRCLEKNRNRRYLTASDLAADVERFLCDQPVDARPPSLAYRATKFVRRNRAGVAVATALAATLSLAIVCLVVSNYLVIREKHQKELALARAVAEKHRADGNLARARRATKEYLLKTSENPSLRQGDFQTLRQELLETALPFYEDFIRQRQNDPELEMERGLAYEDLAFVRQELGAPEAALAELKHAEAIFRDLVARLPKRDEFRVRLSESLNSRGNALHELSRMDAAEAAFREGLEIAEQLARQNDQEGAARETLARIASNLGVLYRNVGRHQDSENVLKLATATRETLIDEQPARPELRCQAAQSLLNLGAAQLIRGHAAEAEQSFLKSLEWVDPAELQRLLDTSDLPVDFQEVRAQALNNLASIYNDADRLSDSERVQREALAIRIGLAERFPSVPRYRHGVSRSQINLAITLSLRGDMPGAEEALRQSLASYEKLTADFPDMSQYVVSQAGTATNLARLLGDIGRREESLPILQQSIDTLEAALRKNERLTKARESLFIARWTRAITLCGLDRNEEALRDWSRALELDDGRYRNEVRLRLATTTLHLARYHDAIANLDAVVLSDTANAEELYSAACGYALAAQSTIADAALAESCATTAIASLRAALASGLEEPKRIWMDPELEALRSRDNFRQLASAFSIPDPSETPTQVNASTTSTP